MFMEECIITEEKETDDVAIHFSKRQLKVIIGIHKVLNFMLAVAIEYLFLKYVLGV